MSKPVESSQKNVKNDKDDQNSINSNNYKNYADANLLIYIIIYIAYLVIGTEIYILLESEKEALTRKKLHEFLKAFSSKYSVKAEDLEDLLRQVMSASEKGINPLNDVTLDANWKFGQSFFFSGTLISTVGYGHVSPQTEIGKLFTILYCLFGIPLTLALLTAFVERLKVPSYWLKAKLNEKFGHLFNVKSLQVLHLSTIFLLVIILLFIVPSIIFSSIETDWTFLDAFYYCFISLTTIGLGDYIPGDQPKQEYRLFYKVITTAYLLIGLCGMMLLLATFYDIPEMNLARFFLLRNESDTNDDERLKLAGQSGYGPTYSPMTLQQQKNGMQSYNMEQKKTEKPDVESGKHEQGGSEGGTPSDGHNVFAPSE